MLVIVSSVYLCVYFYCGIAVVQQCTVTRGIYGLAVKTPAVESLISHIHTKYLLCECHSNKKSTGRAPSSSMHPVQRPTTN